MDALAQLSPQVQAALVSAAVALVVAIVAAVANPLAQRRVERAKAEFQRELETHRNALLAELERGKAEFQAGINREVQLQLGERAAQREYEYDARKRLYLAIGPLRFQLLSACRACANRVQGLGLGRRYAIGLDGYYGRNTIFRLLSPLAIAELIARQIAHSDFAIDRGAMDCLRLRESFSRSLSGDDLVLDHPEVDWTRQTQHLVSGARIKAANALVLEGRDGAEPRALRFDEFDALDLGAEGGPFRAVATLLGDFDPREKSLLWVRLVGLAYSCNEFINRNGGELGFEAKEFPLETLLRASGNAHVIGRIDDYAAAIRANALPPL